MARVVRVSHLGKDPSQISTIVGHAKACGSLLIMSYACAETAVEGLTEVDM